MSKETSRMGFIQQTIASMTAFTLLPSNANAAKYGGFGAGSPEVIDPKAAIVDRDTLNSESVQKALQSIKEYQETVKQLKSTLQSDDQADIGPAIRQKLDFVKLRVDLNTLNSAFDEDTQRGTDRLIRLTLQDITELDSANKQKPNVPRSEKRIAIMIGKLDKLSKSFSDYIKFAV